MTKRGGPGLLSTKTCIERACLRLRARRPRPTSHRSLSVQQRVVASQAARGEKQKAMQAASAATATASSTFKVIDPAGARVFSSWEDDYRTRRGHVIEEVAHLPQGTSVEVTAERGRQVRIVEPKVGFVFLASLEPVEPVASAPDAPAPDVEAPAAPAPAPGDAEMAEAVETQGQANARRRDEITANLDQLAINRPNEYTTLVGALVRLTRDLVGLGASV